MDKPTLNSFLAAVRKAGANNAQVPQMIAHIAGNYIDELQKISPYAFTEFERETMVQEFLRGAIQGY